MPDPETIVVVNGDVLLDFNVLPTQQGRPVFHHSDNIPNIKANVTEGGAWYLEKLIKATVADLPVEVRGVSRPNGGLVPNQHLCNRAYQTWKKFPKTSSDSSSSVWRILDFMGCEDRPQKESGLGKVIHDVSNPRLLVIDDLNLGFRARENVVWPAALVEKGAPQHILVKASPGPDASVLWRQLLSSGWAEKVTIVISVKALRDRCSRISQALSWDRTIEELDDELTRGVSAGDLGRCSRVIVVFDHEGVALYERNGERLAFKRFIYDPNQHEGVWRENYPGRVFGSLSVITTAVARHLLAPVQCPINVSLARALIACRWNHEVGGTFDKPEKAVERSVAEFSKILRRYSEEANLVVSLLSDKKDGQPTQTPDGALDAILRAYQIQIDWAEWEKQRSQDPGKIQHRIDAVRQKLEERFLGPESLTLFATAFAPISKDFQFGVGSASRPNGGKKCDLLRDVTGTGYENVLSKAMQVVREGPATVLAAVPKAKYGRYFTVDREEIERINAIRNLVLTYRNDPRDTRPLSLAVFGAPGSGKSFAIRELISTLLRKDEQEPPLVFNLAEFQSAEDLHEALHQVRDRLVRGRIPLVFWDEFDAGEFRWLKDFLAPMQDAEFRSHGISHPLGKAIFVFAGGTCETFEEFREKSKLSDAKQKKISDFISRLRGFLDIKGPDPADKKSPEQDSAHSIRRAIMLWVSLGKYCQALRDSQAVGTDVVNTFLRAPEFRHGARSIDAIIGMSRLGNAQSFGAWMLPPEESLVLHASRDFADPVRKPYAPEVLELLARAGYEGWASEKRDKHGYTCGNQRNDDPAKGPLTHPDLCGWSKLPPAARRRNSDAVPRRLVALELRGYRIARAGTPPDGSETSITQINAHEIDALIKTEHEIWLCDHLIHGWERGDATNDALFLHQDIRPFEELPKAQQDLNRAIIQAIPTVLKDAGYALVRQEQK